MKTKATPISHPTDIHLKQLFSDATDRFSMINRMIFLMESPKFHFFDSDLVWDVTIPIQNKKGNGWQLVTYMARTSDDWKVVSDMYQLACQVIGGLN